MDRLTRIAQQTAARELSRRALESLFEHSTCAAEALDACSDSFLRDLGNLLMISPPMLDAIRSHPEHLSWLRERVQPFLEEPDDSRLLRNAFNYQQQWESINAEALESVDMLERLRAFKRREYLLIAFLDVSGLLSFEKTVSGLSELAEWIIQMGLRFCYQKLAEEESARWEPPLLEEGFAVIALGKLGGSELNYSSDVDLIFCRRNSETDKELNFFTKLGERLAQSLSRVGPEGFLYRVDMRLRPHGATGPLAPTIDSLVNYYESWGEPWERQALIKARFIAGSETVGKRFQDFVAAFTFARQWDESALEDIKRIKHRAEKEHAVEHKVHLKQGSGGIRDIEFYVQFSQLTIGWKYPEVRKGNTLDAIEALAKMKVLLEGKKTHSRSPMFFCAR